MKLFKEPSALEMVTLMKESTKKQLIDHETRAAYHSKMAEYCREAIKLLEEKEQVN